MKKRADIYFVLYLTAIISFFVVENQVKEYKMSTNKLINRLAFREKLVEIKEPSARVKDNEVIVNLSLEGDYEKESFYGEAVFFKKSDSTKVRTVSLENNGSTNSFTAKIPQAEKIFGKSDTFFVSAYIRIKPLISDFVRAKWRKDLDAKTTHELEKRVSSAGIQELREQIQTEFNIVLNDEKKVLDVPFALSTFSNTLNVISGTEWENKISITGIPSPKDYDVEIIKGRDEFQISVKKEMLYVVLTGTSSSKNGEVKIKAKNKINGKVAETSFNIVDRPPMLKKDNPRKAYVGDEYTFDGRLELINEASMKIKASGVVNTEKEGAIISDIPLEQAGELKFAIFINGKEIRGIEHKVTVIEPGPPEIRYLSKTGNTVVIEVETFGKIQGNWNTSRSPVITSGARSRRKVGERQTNNNSTITTYEIPLEVGESSRVRLSLTVQDIRGKESKQFMKDFQL